MSNYNRKLKRQWRRNTMKRITFEAYKEEDKKALSPRAWLYLWIALRDYPTGDRVQRDRGDAVWKAMNVLADREEQKDGNENVKLRPSGGDLTLSVDELNLLKAAWEKIAVNVPLGFVEQRRYVDDLLDGAQEVDLAKKE